MDTDTTQDDDLELELDDYREEEPVLVQTHEKINRELNGEIITLEQGYVELRLLTTSEMVADSVGLIHGGFIFSAADYAAMLAVNEKNVVLVASDCQFLSPVEYIRSTGGADLVLCGRQASDDDQGVVPALLGESLEMPIVSIARALELVEAAGGPAVRVTRVTPDGDELVEASCPVVVTISNELGEPRFPTTAKKIAARRMKPTIVSADELSLPAEELQSRVQMTRQFVPTVQGNCEFLSGDSPAELADRLIENLRRDSVFE